MPKITSREWLLIFYSVPSHPVSNRMMIWRKLAKVGAVQLKGAVYILPATEEHEEFLQWLIGEVKSMGGDGAFVRSADIRTMTDADIRRLFTTQADQEYHRLEKALDVLERKIQSIRKGSKSEEGKHLADQTAKFTKEFEDVRMRDFFASSTGQRLNKRIQALEAGLRDAGEKTPEEATSIVARRPPDYQKKNGAQERNLSWTAWHRLGLSSALLIRKPHSCSLMSAISLRLTLLLWPSTHAARNLPMSAILHLRGAGKIIRD